MIDINKSKYNYHIIQAPKYTYSRKIKDLIKRKGANLEEILKYYKIQSIDQLDEQQYVQLYENLNKREDIA